MSSKLATAEIRLINSIKLMGIRAPDKRGIEGNSKIVLLISQ